MNCTTKDCEGRAEIIFSQPPDTPNRNPDVGFCSECADRYKVLAERLLDGSRRL